MYINYFIIQGAVQIYNVSAFNFGRSGAVRDKKDNEDDNDNNQTRSIINNVNNRQVKPSVETTTSIEPNI